MERCRRSSAAAKSWRRWTRKRPHGARDLLLIPTEGESLWPTGVIRPLANRANRRTGQWWQWSIEVEKTLSAANFSFIFTCIVISEVPQVNDQKTKNFLLWLLHNPLPDKEQDLPHLYIGLRDMCSGVKINAIQSFLKLAHNKMVHVGLAAAGYSSAMIVEDLYNVRNNIQAGQDSEEISIASVELQAKIVSYQSLFRSNAELFHTWPFYWPDELDLALDYEANQENALIMARAAIALLGHARSFERWIDTLKQDLKDRDFELDQAIFYILTREKFPDHTIASVVKSANNDPSGEDSIRKRLARYSKSAEKIEFVKKWTDILIESDRSTKGQTVSKGGRRALRPKSSKFGA